MSKTISLAIVVIAVIGLYLQSQGKLKPALAEIAGPTVATVGTPLVDFVVAFLVYLFILSFLAPKDGILLTVVIVMGALLINHDKMGNNDLLHTLFNSQ